MAQNHETDWKRAAPRWLLISLVGLFGAISIRSEWTWRNGINDHIVQSAGGYSRLSSVEQEQIHIRNRMDTLTDELRSMRKDQLENYRWQAERVGAKSRAEEIQAQLDRLEGQRP